MNSTQEAVLNRFPKGRFEVVTRSGRIPRMDAKRAKRILRQFQGSILFIKSTGEVQNGKNQTEVPDIL